MDKIYAKGLTKKEYFSWWEHEHRQERNEYRRKKYREKCKKEIENSKKESEIYEK